MLQFLDLWSVRLRTNPTSTSSAKQVRGKSFFIYASYFRREFNFSSLDILKGLAIIFVNGGVWPCCCQFVRNHQICNKMENFENLNTILDEFNIKKATLEVFNLAKLYEFGTTLEQVSIPPTEYGDQVPNVVFDEQDSSFCSIFSDSIEQPNSTQPSQISQFSQQSQFASTQVSWCSQYNSKLLSDGDILSSDFGLDPAAPILTSDYNQKDTNVATEYDT